MTLPPISHAPGNDYLRHELEDGAAYYGHLSTHPDASKFSHETSVDLFEIRDGRASKSESFIKSHL